MKHQLIALPRRGLQVSKKQQYKNDQRTVGKSDWRKYAKICSSDGCSILAKNGGVCKKHGAKVKLCTSEGCSNFAVKGGLCFRHGAKRKTKRCSYEGCTNNAKNGGLCFRHGAIRKRCSYEGCTNKAQRRGVCWRHGANCNQYDESTAFGSEFEDTTANLNLPTAGVLDERRTRVPGEVVICKEVVEV